MFEVCLDGHIKKHRLIEKIMNKEAKLTIRDGEKQGQAKWKEGYRLQGLRMPS
ncbi:MAG: hypothetical protein ABSA79_11115 [Candidatus Bathyarchaeia archaeon]|jgi:hypothetical protein